LEPDLIKLDISLTQHIDTDQSRRALARGLISFGAEVGSRLVGEGVETATELAALQNLGVPYAQGYYLGRPGPLRTR
jgi:EAL domain-containing protein (putative c-di-GMP-specific phosphodiesterase class I)